MGSTIADDCPYIKLLNLLTPCLLIGIETANPSGKFCKPIPMARATAPPIVAPSNPAATPPNKTPTANPSGMLCKVIASTSKVVLCQGVFTPSFSDSLKLICK